MKWLFEMIVLTAIQTQRSTSNIYAKKQDSLRFDPHYLALLVIKSIILKIILDDSTHFAILFAPLNCFALVIFMFTRGHTNQDLSKSMFQVNF